MLPIGWVPYHSTNQHLFLYKVCLVSLSLLQQHLLVRRLERNLLLHWLYISPHLEHPYLLLLKVFSYLWKLSFLCIFCIFSPYRLSRLILSIHHKVLCFKSTYLVPFVSIRFSYLFPYIQNRFEQQRHLFLQGHHTLSKFFTFQVLTQQSFHCKYQQDWLRFTLQLA